MNRSIFLLLLNCISSAFSYKIIGIFHLPLKSHYLFASPLMTELAERGHRVTVYTHFPKPKEQIIPNYEEVDLSMCSVKKYDFELEIDDVKRKWGSSSMRNAVLFPTGDTARIEDIERCSPLKQLLNTTEKYDLLITETFQSDASLMFANKFKIPFITTTPNLLASWHAARVASAANPSYVPTMGVVDGYLSSMTFLQRVENTLAYVISMTLYYTITMRQETKVTRHFLGASTPSLYEIVKNTSLIISNSDVCLNPAFPTVPNVIRVAGMQIKAAKALPKDIEKFINESTHGVVYFCMGSLLRGETFPEAKRNAFLDAFSKIPQRVLWKWEGDVLPGKSDKIMISKWMPQRDILAHPKVKLFISHGGLLGTSEAVYEGVPILGIPIFGDQRTNLKSIEVNGAGEILDYNDISKEVVFEKISRLINNPEYKKNAIDLSIRYKDRPMSPLDTAVYWTEYVIRHKGAPHLKTAAVNMPWYQYLLLDVIAFLLFILISAIIIIYYSTKLTLRFIYNLIFGSKYNKATESDKKVKRS